MNEIPLRVLLVDDEVSFRNQLKKYLQSQHGYQVTDVGDGRAAQESVANNPGAYHVALVDEILEGEVSGFELLQWIKAHAPQIEVIVFTTWGMDNALNALRAGAYRYLTKPFNPEELALLVKLAAEVAELRDAAREKDVLSNLMMVSTALLSGRREDEILKVALQAIHAIGFDRVRLYELQENGAYLCARAHIGMDDSFLQARWKTEDDELMQQVLRDPRVHVFRRRKGEEVPYEDVLDKGDVDEWICAPLVVEGQVIGKLSADKKYSRAPVTDAEKEPLALFTSIAAMAVENNRLLASARQRAEELEKLHKNILAITANQDRETLLRTIIQGAVELLGARRGGIYEYNPSLQKLTVVADYGYGQSTRGQVLKLGEGLAGELIASEEPYAIVDDYGSWPRRSTRYNPEEFRAVLEVPLLWSEQRTGVLYVEDEVGRQFTVEDAHLLSRFAGHAAIALEQARHMAEMSITLDNHSRLIENSFDGIIAVDMQGRITEFNSQAEKILEYQRSEVIGQPVSDFYSDPQEPRRIGRMLHTSRDARVVDHRAKLKSKAGLEIPVRMSATWLYNADGQRAGSVGYFKDVRYIQQVERHRQLLLEANEAVARAESLDQGLQKLAENMALGCHSTFCLIYLRQPGENLLEVRAAHPIAREQELAWDPNCNQTWLPEQHPLFSLAVERGETVILDARIADDDTLLREIAGRVNLAGSLNSGLIVPLSLNGKVRGLCVLGEMRSWKRQPFEEVEIRLVEALAKDATALLEKMELQELTSRQLEESERQRRLWETLAQSFRYIHPARERDHLQQEIVNQVADLMDYPYACLLIYHPVYRQLEVIRVHNLPESIIGARFGVESEPFQSAAASGEIQFLDDITADPVRYTLFGTAPVRSALFVPFKGGGNLVALLALGSEGLCKPSNADLEVIRRFSTQAVTALRTSELIGSEKRKVAQLLLLDRISEYIQQPNEDLAKIFDAALTGVTAVYGLGFNRAAILLADSQRKKWIGCKGIGHLDKKKAEKDWARYHQEGMDDVNRYLTKLASNQLSSTPLDARIQKLEIEIQDSTDDPLFLVVDRQRPVLLTDDQVARLPINFSQAFEPGASFTIAPLIARQEVIGLLVADNKFTSMPVTEELLENLMTFANAIALAVDNAQMVRELKRSQSLQRALFEASGELLSTLDPQEVLDRIVSQGRKAADAFWVSLLMIGDDGRVEVLAMDGLDLQVEPEEIVRPKGIGLSHKIMLIGSPEVIHNVKDRVADINPRMLEVGVQAAVGLPVILNGTAIGVMWVHYKEPHIFTPSEIEALQLYANQAAMAYDSRRRSMIQQRMREAAEDLSRADDLEEAAGKTPACFKSVLECESVAFFLYDDRHKRFSPDQAWHTGVDAQIWSRLPGLLQSDKRFINRQFPAGWIAVEDLPRWMEPGSNGSEAVSLLKTCGVRSFQLLPLRAGDDPLGFILALDTRPQPQNKEMLEMAQTFADQTALILNKALLMKQTQRAMQAVERVAQVMTQGDFRETKMLLVESTKGVVECDAVVLYSLDEETGILEHPPTMIGVRHEDRARRFTRVEPESLVYRMLERTEPYRVENIAVDPYFKDSRFAKDEKIQAVVAVPLIAYGKKKGIMFVNYRTEQIFSEAVLNNIELFAHQAAIAVHYAKLLEKEKQRLNQLSDMYAELERVKGELAAKETLAWIGLLSSTFRHSLSNYIITIGDNVKMIVGKAAKRSFDQEIAYEVELIQEVVKDIEDMMITTPLRGEEGVYPFSVSELLRERISQKQHTFRGIQVDLRLESDESATVRADPHWIRRALDILLDNAVEAMEYSDQKSLVVSTGCREGRVEIRIVDTGPGIPPAIQPFIFKGIVPKENREKGLGIGLLIAHMIFRTFAGDIKIEKTTTKGTTMMCWLPSILPDDVS